MDIYISKGNRRMNIPTWSLPAIQTCPGATNYCLLNCYAIKAERVWKNPRLSRLRNLEATRDKNFVQVMIHDISDLKDKYFRIHESGDFYSQEYLNKWIEICKYFVDKKKFLIYTQRYNLDWSKIPENVIRYWTVWPDSRNVPIDGLKAYVVDDGSGKLPNYKYNHKAKFCIKGKGCKLMCDNCMYCFEGRGDVIFKLH
jgi:hypothetical protein